MRGNWKKAISYALTIERIHMDIDQQTIDGTLYRTAVL
jgi:hypothetical protein